MRAFCRLFTLIFSALMLVQKVEAVELDWVFPKFPSFDLCLQHVEGKGLGYSEGYSSLDLFLVEPFFYPSFSFFVDLRGHVFNNGRHAGNAGAGLRGFNKCLVWGINGYYDYTHSRHQPYCQWALGMELLGRSWELRINAYFPYGTTSRFLHEGLHLNRAEAAMRGVDSEIGYRYCCGRLNLYVGAGPYFYYGHTAAMRHVFHRKSFSAAGGRASVHALFFEHVTLDGWVTCDTRFSWGGQVCLGIDVPFDLLVREPCCRRTYNDCSLESKLSYPVYRNEIVVTKRIHTKIQRCKE